SGRAAIAEPVPVPVEGDAEAGVPSVLAFVCEVTASPGVNQLRTSAVYIKAPTTRTPARNEKNIDLNEVRRRGSCTCQAPFPPCCEVVKDRNCCCGISICCPV